MGRILIAIGLSAAVLVANPASAATAQQKKETCEFGASDQKLQGAARKKFMANCMANRDSPRGKPVPAAKPL